ncbi:alkaline-phosphatase-like protein [Globomyces pollinis-pini]|nr:alkaline-phosphatase-like protein [Globomyces pollinis-pini]
MKFTVTYILFPFTIMSQLPNKPNIVFFLADDHDAFHNMEQYMPNFQELFGKGGTKFNNHFTNTPVCCPSRMSILSGKTTHNHNLTDTLPPHGGYTKMREMNLDAEYLPGWLQQEGYNTYMTGKLFVEYTLEYGEKNVPVGWNDFDAAVYPFTFDYKNPVFSKNGGKPQLYPGQYNTDVLAQKTLAQLNDAAERGDPFFSYIAPIGCHIGVDIKLPLPTPPAYPDVTLTAPIPAPRHEHMFPNLTVPMSENYNEEDRSDKPIWIKHLTPLNANNKTYLDGMYRSRVLSLLAVDDLIGDVVKQLKANGTFDNTIFFYSSDNGYHLGSHGMLQGKKTCYEEDIKVPFYVSGPGIAKGKVSNIRTSHIDIAPTLTALAGRKEIPISVDGSIIPIFEEEKLNDAFLVGEKPRGDYTGIEFWGSKLDEGAAIQFNPNPPAEFLFPNFTYKGVRMCTIDKFICYKYIVYCTGDYELYDLKKDPFELNNLLPGRNQTIPNELSKLQNRLDALTSVLAKCKGVECTNPIQSLHPENPTLTFKEIMNSRFDEKYSNLIKFKYLNCQLAFGNPLPFVSALPDPFQSINKRDQPQLFQVRGPVEDFGQDIDSMGEFSKLNFRALLEITQSIH